jgi:PadR family transcriptional regulator AphA
VNVKDLCLGALTFGDASGYDLKKFFETTFSQFCSAGYGSIYPALAELTAAGLVSCHALRQRGKPDRKIYHLTAAGHWAFLHTLQHTGARHCVKSDFLLALYFAHLLPAERLEHLLDGRIADLDRQLEETQKTERHAPKKSSQAAGPQFVCGYGRAVMSAARDYLSRHRRTLIVAPRPADHQTVKSIRRNRASRPGLQSR